MADERLTFDILARDNASSTFKKVARAADDVNKMTEKAVKVNDAVTKSSARLQKARDAEADAMGKVHVAEQRLAEVRGNANAKASQLVAAEERLLSARRKAAQASSATKLIEEDLRNSQAKVTREAEKVGEKTGKSFGSGLKKWLTGKGADLGKQGGTVFGSGFLGMLKTPILGPALIAALGGAVAVAAPAVGAIAAAGLIAGFGAGLAGLGMVFAAKSKAVQQQWKKTLDFMGAQMTALSKPFENTLIAMSLVAKRTFASFAPILGEAFKRMAPVLAGFGDQLGRGLERLKPAILPLTDAFNAVIKTLGPAVQSAIGKVSDGLIKLAASVQRSPGAIADLVRGMGDLVKTTLDLITMLNDVNAKFKDLTGISAVTAVMGGLNGVLMGTKLALQGITAPIGLLDAGLQKVGLKSKSAGQDQASFSTALFTTAAAINKLIPPAESLAQKFQRQAAATNALITSLFRLSGLALTLSGSQTALAQAVADATQSIKDNGHTLDINTQKGRNNRNALDAVAQAANAQTEAMIRSGKGTAAAGLSAEKSRTNFIRIATQMGLSKKQAQALAAQLIAIPNVSREARLKANKADLDAKLRAAKAQLNDKDLTRERRAQLNATIAKLQAQVRAAQAAINGLHGKTVVNNVITKYTSTGVNLQTPSSVGRRATGGPVSKGESYIVGEHRPELFVPSENGKIIPRVPAQGRSQSSGQVTLRIESGGSRMDDFIVDLLRKYVRVNGGNVQTVLGRG